MTTKRPKKKASTSKNPRPAKAETALPDDVATVAADGRSGTTFYGMLFVPEETGPKPKELPWVPTPGGHQRGEPNERELQGTRKAWALALRSARREEDGYLAGGEWERIARDFGYGPLGFNCGLPIPTEVEVAREIALRLSAWQRALEYAFVFDAGHAAAAEARAGVAVLTRALNITARPVATYADLSETEQKQARAQEMQQLRRRAKEADEYAERYADRSLLDAIDDKKAGPKSGRGGKFTLMQEHMRRRFGVTIAEATLKKEWTLLPNK